ncbi:MAG: DUF2249 domain-containing protein [Haloarculaceae archaeon]
MAAKSSRQTLDVRQIEGEPFGTIMSALDELDPDESLVVVNSFEPEPLYAVLTERGYTYEADQVDSDEWHVEISHAE